MALAQPAAQAPQPPPAADAVVAGSRLVHVLVADGDPETLVAVRAALGDAAAVAAVPDAYQALAHLQAHEVDLLVTELLLPGAGGLELVRRADPRVPVVVVTHAPSEARAVVARAAAVLRKPVDPAEFEDVLRAALGVSRRRPAGAGRPWLTV